MKRFVTILKYCVIVLIISASNLNAQQINSLYFLENTTVRHHLNAAFQPTSNFYFGLPVISNLQFGYTSDFPTYKTALFSPGHTLNLQNDKSKLLIALKPMNAFDAGLKMNLLDMGIRMNSNYWTFSLSSKVDLTSNLPYSGFDLLLNNAYINNGFSADLGGLNMRLNAYTEAALGYSRDLKGVFGFGIKAKLLYGNSYFSIKANQANASVTGKNFQSNADISVVRSSFLETDNQLNLKTASGFFPYIKPYGIGGALDLGFYYKPLPFLTLSLAVNDLGMINWGAIKSKIYSLNYQFDEAKGNTWLSNHPEFTEVPLDSVISDLKSNLSSSETAGASVDYYLSPKMNVGLELGVFKNKISLGILSRSMLRNQTLLHELTSSLNIRPIDWLNLSFSYSVTNGNMSNIGLGLSTRMKKVNLFLIMDYIPAQYVGLDLQQFNPLIPAMNFPLAYNANRMNFGIGLNYVLGSRKDSDKDGIDDKFDKCADTPFGVKVDNRGCPLDKDKDGVADYLDKCAETPKEARLFVGEDGCPLDTDGDSIPDYLDKCPETPLKAKKFVNESGCPKDTDKDGVWDYLDKCPETPLGITVDSVGCPVDTDGDEVPDYLDLCENTPYACRGFVDKNGCPIDSDDDGVLDYLDLCPETPVEARGFVDINGCLIDADDDGVADYIDDCPGTPIEARGLVNHRGCPKDTDFDSIPDFKDDCPRVPGVARNNGCPEVKKEVRTLIQKAVQGIQFEKDTMCIASSSFETLNQIVTAMNENSGYMLEIQGHSDNVIKPHHLRDMNIIQPAQTDSTVVLPEKSKEDIQKENTDIKTRISLFYANLVKQYIISRGVDEHRLVVKGFGDTKPLASNETDAGRAKNRRVELVIIFEEK
jgi:outer membrane protein OmpA-like peptidoglycan-associated protein